MVRFSKGSNSPFIGDDDDDEEPGEEIESAPPLKVGQERELKISSSINGFKKKLLKRGSGWETPKFGDEVTVHYVGTLVDGTTKFASTRDKNEPITFKLGNGEVVAGLDQGIITMLKGEIALFTLPPELGYAAAGADGVPSNSVIQFEVELVSWIAVMDVYRNGGILKKIMQRGEDAGPPNELDEVLVRYTAKLVDGTVVAKSPEEGVQFYIKDGHFCRALTKAIKTMKKGEKATLIVQPEYAFGKEGKVSVDDFSAIPPNSVLRIDVLLLSFSPVIEITEDLKVIKKIVREGEGAYTANESAVVTVRYKAMLEDGTVFESKGFDGSEPLEFTTDEEQVIAGLDRAAITMKKGERAVVTISPEYGFGTDEVKRDLATVPPSSTVVYDVEMLKFSREKAPWEMNTHERIETAGKKKDEGNLLFKIGKYHRARKKYDKASDYVSEDGSFEGDDQKLVKSLRVSCWLNGAACSLKLNEFQEAIKLCSKVLDVEFCNLKALYRRAQAYIETEELHLAELDIKKALENDPDNKEVKLIQKRLRQVQADSDKRDAKLYTTMFTRMTKDTSVAAKRMKVEKEPCKKKDEEITMEMEKIAVNSAPDDDRMAVDSQ